MSGAPGLVFQTGIPPDLAFPFSTGHEQGRPTISQSHRERVGYDSVYSKHEATTASAARRRRFRAQNARPQRNSPPTIRIEQRFFRRRPSALRSQSRSPATASPSRRGHRLIQRVAQRGGPLLLGQHNARCRRRRPHPRVRAPDRKSAEHPRAAPAARPHAQSAAIAPRVSPPHAPGASPSAAQSPAQSPPRPTRSLSQSPIPCDRICKSPAPALPAARDRPRAQRSG